MELSSYFRTQGHKFLQTKQKKCPTPPKGSSEGVMQNVFNWEVSGVCVNGVPAWPTCQPDEAEDDLPDLDLLVTMEQLLPPTPAGVDFRKLSNRMTV